MKNKFIYKFSLCFFTVISILCLGFFNFYMSSYYNNISIGISYILHPSALFSIILIIVFIQLILASKLRKNK